MEFGPVTCLWEGCTQLGFAAQAISSAFFSLPANWKKENPAEDSEALKMVKPCDGRDFGPEGGHGLESTHPVL